MKVCSRVEAEGKAASWENFRDEKRERGGGGGGTAELFSHRSRFSLSPLSLLVPIVLACSSSDKLPDFMPSFPIFLF